MKVSVDQPRHRKLAGGLDHLGAVRAGQVLPNCRDLVAFNQDIGAREFAVLGIKREDMRIADQRLHLIPANRLPQRAPRLVSTPAWRSASHTPIDTVS